MIQVLRQLVLLVLLAFVVDASAQTALSKGELFAVVTLDQEVRSLGEPLSVSITNGPATVGSAAIRLARDGLAYDLAANYSPPGNGKAVGVAIVGKLETAANSPKLVLGNYLVVVELDGVSYPAPTEKKLQIVPLGNPALKLEPFDPPSTDRKRKAYFDDSRIKPKAGSAAEYGASNVVTLILRGNGFQQKLDDNIFYLNHRRQKDVIAGKCNDGANVLDSGMRKDSVGAASIDGSTNATQTAARVDIIKVGEVANAVEGEGLTVVDYGTDIRPVARTIVAEIVSTDEIRLCRVPVPDTGELLAQVRVGDFITAPQTFLVYSRGTVSVAMMSLAIAVALGLIPLLMLETLRSTYSITYGWDYKKLLLFMDPETDTYSLSKFQFYLWTLAALFGYAYLFISHVFVQRLGWPDVPGTLPGILAFSAGTSIGSQLITSTKGSKGAGATHPSLSDFITSGGVVAPDRVQMLVWTLFGIGAFIIAILGQAPSAIKGLPPIPAGLMYLMGLSSLGYLGGKMARKAGPVVNEISIDPADPEDVMSRMIAGPPAEPPDLGPVILEAKRERATFAQPTSSLALAAQSAVEEAIASASSAQTTTDFNYLVDKLVALRAIAEQRANDVADLYAAETDAVKKIAAATDANIAQAAAALLQSFSADVTQALATAAASPMLTVGDTPLLTRTITLRGTNLAPDALFEIDKSDLPFRMLWNSEGSHEPEVLAREPSTPTLARMLKLTLDPSRLGDADLTLIDKWFATTGMHTFTITNPDGQKAELPFSLPPGVTQK